MATAGETFFAQAIAFAIIPVVMAVLVFLWAMIKRAVKGPTAQNFGNPELDAFRRSQQEKKDVKDDSTPQS